MNGGQKLKKWLTDNKMKTLDACVRLRVYPNHISRLTSGASKPSLATAFLIEKMTGGEVTARDFLEGEAFND